METNTYLIRRGDEHLPHAETVELRIHAGKRLMVDKEVDYEVRLTDEQVAQLEADGYRVIDPADKLPAWPLKSSPAEYLAEHENDDDPSPGVAERITLAKRHVAAEKE